MAQSGLTGFGDAATATSAAMDKAVASIAAAAGATLSAKEGVAALTPALEATATATERVSREAIVLPLHLAHLGEAAATGTVSMRSLGSVLSPFREGLGAVAGAIGISVTALVGLTLGLGFLGFEIIKTIKGSQDLGREIEGMGRGVAEGMGHTGESVEKATDAIVKMTNVAKSDADEISKAYVNTGNVTDAQLTKLGASTVELAARQGESVTATGKAIAAALKDPEKGIDDLTAKYITFDSATESNARTLAASGKSAQAAAILIAALNKEVEGSIKPIDGVTGALNTSRTVLETTVGVMAHWFVATKAGSDAQGAAAKATEAAAKASEDDAKAEGDDTKATEANTSATAVNTASKKANAKELSDQVAKAHEVIAAYAPQIAQLATLKGNQDALNAAMAAGEITGQQYSVAMEGVADAVTAAQTATGGAYEAMIKLQDEEAKASDAAAAAMLKDTSAVDANAAALKADAAAVADFTGATQTAEEAGSAWQGEVQKATAALTAESAALGTNATAANTDATAVNSDSLAQGGLASAAASAANAAQTSGNITTAGSGAIPSQSISFKLDDPTFDKIKALQAAIAKLGNVASSSPDTAPGGPPAPPTASAGATVASQPGAFGGDKNPSFFSDPATRQTFLGQFGIQGDAATKSAERQYQQAVQAYQLQVVEYNAQVATDGIAKQQLAVMEKQLAALLKENVHLPGARGTYGGALGISAASGGDWRVSGAPGQDANLVSMNLSHGELVSVTPPGQSAPQGGGGAPVIHQTINIATPNVAEFRKSRASIANDVAALMAAGLRNRTTGSR